MKTKMYLPDVVGKGYGTFWNYKGRYRVLKGSRASKKSTTTAMNLIWQIMAYPGSNALVVRKVARTLADSCFAQLKWATHRLGCAHKWTVKQSPMELIYRPTGQKIIFRGLDDPLKVTSVTVDVGHLCFLWIEEAYEIMKEEDFDYLDESIRGKTPPGLFKQVTLTFNPWNERHWIKRRFFDEQDPDVLAMTTNYLCNEWLDERDYALFERMKKHNPRRYRVAGLGEWGVVEGLVYENWREELFDIDALRGTPLISTAFGLDFGYTNDPSGLFCGLVDKANQRLYVFDEMYGYGMSNKKIYETVRELGYAKEIIRADSAEPKSLDELRGLGLRRIRAANKGKDSVCNGIQYIQDLEIIIHPRCVNFITEISNYTWEVDKFGDKLNVPIGDFNHLMDAMRYGMEPYIFGDVFSFN